MDFDFYELYKDHPTVELLKIAERPENYQPAAVEAARRRLSEREIPEADRTAVQAFFDTADEKARAKSEKINQLKQQAADFLPPLTQPASEFQPQKWLNLFLVILILRYGWMLIQSLIALYHFIVALVLAGGFGVHEEIGYGSAFSHLFSFSVLIDLITLVYVPRVIYLLYKRRRWGWIFVFANSWIEVIGIPVQIYSYSIYLKAFQQGISYGGDWTELVVKSVLGIAFVAFLWRKDIRDLFGATKKTRTETILYASSVAVILGGWAYFFS